MSVITQEISLGKWDNRENLDYRPVNTPINGKYYNACGVEVNNSLAGVKRRPCKIDQQGATAYVMFDDDSFADVVIYRITEV